MFQGLETIYRKTDFGISLCLALPTTTFEGFYPFFYPTKHHIGVLQKRGPQSRFLPQAPKSLELALPVSKQDPHEKWGETIEYHITTAMDSLAIKKMLSSSTDSHVS